jgi:general secretion pathway protein G
VVKKVSVAFSAKIRADLATIDAALDAYAARNGGTYPESLDVLARHDANGAAFLDPLPLDPWKRPYLYEPPKTPGALPRVLTYGHDGKPGGVDLDADVDDTSIRAR